jgi:hypothetical protein
MPCASRFGNPSLLAFAWFLLHLLLRHCSVALAPKP